ncbi:hypothetical protein K505DRAFT_279169 [Melanomma pulvis-pyrius CBS 109.77]|uniref:gamma-glutamylcyclotransferase n=1 Tax=Melanomma pulvis-pyrius CBS 109.77 TaxID=1314802 RepID=A0A6A6X6Y6_9PLEO|nr:hypothetical protein K505DRAFT_279169 [Melanomma pulvis-pyrius CBS 109.77]
MTAMSPHKIATTPDQTSGDPELAPACMLRRAVNNLCSSQRSTNASPRAHPRLPPPSKERLEASVTETPLDVGSLSCSDLSAAEEKGKTVLYLAYGSNLCNETFRENRGIRPLSQVNVLVPSLKLTFDLPGIPYHEPCFANSALRNPDEGEGELNKDEYHKDRWHKGMVGCVYEVTPTDYAHIIATEGGGASYQDILVPCYPLSDADTVPKTPSSTPFKAHTLFAPVATSTRVSRPDPSYAQPSARYMKLITDGASELGLPREYQIYLNDIRSYTITSTRQALGQKLVQGVWWPIIMAVFALSGRLQDKDGKAPKWVGTLMGWLFLGMWTSYDGVWKGVFGDGERTEGDEEDEEARLAWTTGRNEKGVMERE